MLAASRSCAVMLTLVHSLLGMPVAATISSALRKFFDDSHYPMIFTGAGVSARAGLPTWVRLITLMAGSLQTKDALTAQQMKECVAVGDLLRAVDYFNLSNKMVQGDKFKLIRQLLSNYDATKIGMVANLPFRGVITTNFDRSILDSIAVQRKKSAVDFIIGDSSFKQAQWEQSLFVARIHGAIEFTSSIILSSDQFDNIQRDETYNEFLRQCFVHRDVLFVGFSFYDPAIKKIFEGIDKSFGPLTPGRHMALLSHDASAEFVNKAHRLNIEVVRYDSADNHKQLWEGIESFDFSPIVVAGVPQTPLNFTKSYLAACYARVKISGSQKALRESLAEGIVSAILQGVSPKQISRDELISSVRHKVGLTKDGAKEIVEKSLDALLDAGLIRISKEDDHKKYAWNGTASETGSLSDAYGLLSDSVKERAKLQEAWSIDPGSLALVPKILDHFVRTRGWDLGAAYASGKLPDRISVDSIFNEFKIDLPAFDKERLIRVLSLLFQNPTSEESLVLGELGKISFALEMAFRSPVSVLLHEVTLPHRIYFDASFLLPAIVEGHPLSDTYMQAIRRLKDAASAAAIDLKLSVSSVYLNEIISHKNNASIYRREAGDTFNQIATRDALYSGAANTNVYVGAFASWINSNPTSNFDDYIEKFAPYRTEGDLRRWLIARGFEVVEGTKTGEYASIYSQLESKYADALVKGKTPLLIEHDAIQLARLQADIGRNERILFVTADRQLRNFVAEIGYDSLADGMISNLGLIQFIELMLGGISNSTGLTELLWSPKLSEKSMAVRSYFTTIALQKYDDGFAMALPEVVEYYSDYAVAELQRQNKDLDTENPRKRAEAFSKLGMLEAGYYQKMNSAVDKLKEELGK